MSPDSLCKWQVQVSVYCARRISAHHRCTQCSFMLHSINICFVPCICLSQIQTCLCVVVGPGFVSTSPAFMRSSASYPSGPHGCFPPKNGKSDPHCWGREVLIDFAQQLAKATVTAPPIIGCVIWSLFTAGSVFLRSVCSHVVVGTLCCGCGGSVDCDACTVVCV